MPSLPTSLRHCRFSSDTSVLGPPFPILVLPVRSDFCDRLLMLSYLKHPDTSTLGSPRHLYGGAETSSTTFPASSTVALPPIPQAAVSYRRTQRPHLSLSTTGRITTGHTNLHTRARDDSYLAMTRPYDVRDACNAVA